MDWAVAWTVKRTQSNDSSRSPPLVVRTVTLFPLRLATQASPADEPMTAAPATMKLDGTSTTTQPISWLLSRSASGSSLVAVRVNVVGTPVVAARGVATSVHNRAP